MRLLAIIRSILSFLRKNPNVIVTLMIVGVLYYGYSLFQNQKEEVTQLKATVENLTKVNKEIKDANDTLTADMKSVKEGMETYQANLAKIKQQTGRLQQSVNDPKFKELLKTDVKQAEKKFNSEFNTYLDSINKDTKKNAQ